MDISFGDDKNDMFQIENKAPSLLEVKELTPILKTKQKDEFNSFIDTRAQQIKELNP